MPSKRTGLKLLGLIGAELAVWMLVPVSFLVVYVRHFVRSPEAVAPHLAIVLTLWFVGAAVRLVRWRWAPGRRLPRLLLSFSLATVLFVGLLYYALVLVGLVYWNNVISWELIRSYSTEIGPLADALEIPLAFVLPLLAVGHVGMWRVVTLHLERWDWTRRAAARFRPGAVALGVSLVLLLAVIQSMGFSRGHWAYMDEPLSLTFQTPPYHFQNHAMGGRLRAQNSLADQLARMEYVPARDARRRNVILVVVDGLRPDHLGVFGYDRNTTPVLSALADERGVRKTGLVKSICAESLCGLLGMAASNYIHGFSEHPVTLQEVLRRHGYGVHMLLSGDHTNFYNLRELYGEVDTFVDGSTMDGYANEDRLMLEAIAELPDWDGPPVMLQFHLMSPHLLRSRRSEPVFAPATRYSPLARNPAGDGRVRSPEIVNFYDNGVLEADRTVGEILAVLEERGYLGDALVVVTSDHGEGLGEHGLFGHANSVYGPVLWVPLLIFDFGGPPTPLAIDTTRLASVVDIAPTILRELGMPAPSSWVGEPLQDPPSRTSVLFQQGPLIGLVDEGTPGGPWKFWVDVRSEARFVFNLGADPTETCNLADIMPSNIVARWEEHLPLPGPLGDPPTATEGAAPPDLEVDEACETVLEEVSDELALSDPGA